jgi:hypothetical protein
MLMLMLKSLFMRLGELSDDICNRLDSDLDEGHYFERTKVR